MIEWKDSTLYSRSDKNRTPRTIELEVMGMRIIIHKIIHLKSWFITCYKLDIEDRPLDADNLEKAKKEGLELIIKNIELLWKIRKTLIDEIVE